MAQSSRAHYRVLTEKDIPMITRDGVTLRADVYRPDVPGRFPVLLSRLPYNKNLRPRPGDIDCFVERGYVVIMQDTRGRFASEGEEYYPLIWEAQDGYDAVEWAARLPYADGNVGTMGQSYLGATQYLLAPTRPPHLKAAFPASAAADFHQGLWTCVGQGAQTCTEARSQNHRFHLPWLSRPRWRTATSRPALPRKWFASCSAKYTDRCCPPVHPKETIRFWKPRLW